MSAGNSGPETRRRSNVWFAPSAMQHRQNAKRRARPGGTFMLFVFAECAKTSLAGTGAAARHIIHPQAAGTRDESWRRLVIDARVSSGNRLLIAQNELLAGADEMSFHCQFAGLFREGEKIPPRSGRSRARHSATRANSSIALADTTKGGAATRQIICGDGEGSFLVYARPTLRSASICSDAAAPARYSG